MTITPYDTAVFIFLAVVVFGSFIIGVHTDERLSAVARLLISAACATLAYLSHVRLPGTI
jgi:hypothetical protein